MPFVDNCIALEYYPYLRVLSVGLGVVGNRIAGIVAELAGMGCFAAAAAAVESHIVRVVVVAEVGHRKLVDRSSGSAGS